MAALKEFLEVMKEPEIIADPEAMKDLLKIMKIHLVSKRTPLQKTQKDTDPRPFDVRKGTKISSIYSCVTKKWKSQKQITREGINAYGKPYNKRMASRTCQRCLDKGVSKGWFLKQGSGKQSRYRLI